MGKDLNPRVGERWWRGSLRLSSNDPDKYEVAAWSVKCVGINRAWREWEMGDGYRYKTRGVPNEIKPTVDAAIKEAIVVQLWRMKILSKKYFEEEAERMANMFVREFYPEGK